MFEAFLHYLRSEKRFSPNTVLAYQSDLTQFQSYLLETYATDDWVEVTHFHIRSWMVSMLEQGLSARSMNRKLSSLHTFYRFLRKRSYLDSNPLNKINAPKSGKKLPAILRETEMKQLLEADLFPNDFEGMRDHLLLNMLYQTGMRRAEIISLRHHDIMLSDQMIRITGKGSKERRMPIGKDLIAEIIVYKTLLNSEFSGTLPDSFFVTIKGAALYPGLLHRVVNRYLRMVSTVDQKSPHVLRHSFATHLSDKGADLNAIKVLLGHANLAATQVYMHNSIEKLKSVYAQAHPKADKTE